MAATKLPVVLVHGVFGYGRQRPLYDAAWAPPYWPERSLDAMWAYYVLVDVGVLSSDHCEAFYQFVGGQLDDSIRAGTRLTQHTRPVSVRLASPPPRLPRPPVANAAGPSAKDLTQRLSRSRSLRDGGTLAAEVFNGAVSPACGGKAERGAASGAAIEPSAWDRRWLGLAAHSAVVGFMSTALPIAVYPFMTCNLNMEGTQTLSVRMLLALPWVLKPLFMAAIDGLPLPTSSHGRKACLALGWAVTAAALTRIFFIDQPPPFFGDRSLVGTPLRDLTVDQRATISPDAPSRGALYTAFMVIAAAGYVLADVAADGLAREVASLHLRPAAADAASAQDELLVPMLTKWRALAALATFPFMGVAMSGRDYGGAFRFTLRFTELMLVVGVVAALPIPLAFVAIRRAPAETTSTSLGTDARAALWSSLRNRAVANVLALRFVSGVLGGFSAVAVSPVAFYFAGVQPLNDNVVSFVAGSAVLLALHHADKGGWRVNSRLVTVSATAAVLVLDCGAAMFALWGVVRSQWLWIGLPVMEAIPSVLDHVIFADLLAELADPGAELLLGAVVAATASVANALGLALSKLVDAQFAVSNQDVMEDSRSTRVQLTGVFLLAYAAQVLSVVCVAALPRHASEAREQKAASGRSTARAAALLAALALSLALATSVHALSVNGATACLGIVGGTGC